MTLLCSLHSGTVRGLNRGAVGTGWVHANSTYAFASCLLLLLLSILWCLPSGAASNVVVRSLKATVAVFLGDESDESITAEYHITEVGT